MYAVDHLDRPEWRKSRRCDTAACVEVAKMGGDVLVRDRARSVLTFSAGAWRAFLARTGRTC